MRVKIDSLWVDYDIQGTNQPLLMLHGWSKGLDRKRYKKLFDLLTKKYRVISFDFPGFGESDLPSKPWSVSDYANFTAKFLDKLNIKSSLIVGHSFGGRVAIKMVNLYPEKAKGLVLIDSAGVERKSLKVKAIITLTKMAPFCLKKLFKSFLGSKDFKGAEGVMRETLKLVVAENLELEIKEIKKPTLIIWGRDDMTTPLWQGKLIHSWVKGSKLVVVKKTHHGLPWQNPEKVAQEIFEFLP